MSDNGIHLTVFAKKVGFPYRTVQNYISGKTPPKAQFYEAVCEIYGVSLDWLFFGRGQKFSLPLAERNNHISSLRMHQPGEFVSISSFSTEASAGHGSAIASEDATGQYAFKREWLDQRGLKPSKLSVISVLGDSMEPDLYNGDLILIDHATTDLAESHIYAVRFSDALYVKRVQHLPGNKVHLISSNRSYPPIEIPHPEADGVQIIGRVVASMHEW